MACPMIVYETSAIEFTVSRSLMKLFQTISATVVSDCTNFFALFAQIDIRTAKFTENFVCSENYICTLFENKADSYLKKIFSVRNIRSFVTILELVSARVKCHCHYVFLAFLFHICYFIFASCYAAASGE